METATQTQEKGFWDDAEIIDRYTRAEAIADKALIDVTASACSEYFKLPTAITATIYTVTDTKGKIKRIDTAEEANQ